MSKELLEQLSAPFKPGEVKQRTQGGRQLDYIGIDTTINRLNTVLGNDWSIANPSWSVTDGNVVVQLEVKALGKVAWGVGADKLGNDFDKAIKTALAEAIKKAGHQLGVGLYLWDEGQRANVQEGRQAANGDLGSLKNQVFKAALAEGLAEQTPDGIAKHFGIPVTDLQNVAILTDILKKRGKL